MNIFCPYQNLEVETTHMNCSLIHAQLVLIVLITLTKRGGKKKTSVKAHLPVVMHIRHVPVREVQGHRVTRQAPLFHFTLSCLLCSNRDGQAMDLFVGPSSE
jgi:hypothetical protein